MASVVEPPAIEALDDARRELGAALGELRELGEELDGFAEQATAELEAYREALLHRGEELESHQQQFVAQQRAEESSARQVEKLEQALAAAREELSQQREQGEGLNAELAKVRQATAQLEEAQREADSLAHQASTAQSDQQALLLSELESLRSHASQLEEELEEARRVSAMAAPQPRPGQEAHLSGLIEQLTTMLSHGIIPAAAAPAAPPQPPQQADGSSAVVGSLKEQFARLQMQAARRRESA